MMPYVVDNSAFGFARLADSFNKGIPGGPGGEEVRRAAYDKLMKINAKGAWSAKALISSLVFAPKDDDRVSEEVYKHFQGDWLGGGRGWFPKISAETVATKIGRGFLAALHTAIHGEVAKKTLPIDIVWVCADPNPKSTEMFVEHVWSEHQLTIVIATPVPQVEKAPWYPPKSRTEEILAKL